MTSTATMTTCNACGALASTGEFCSRCGRSLAAPDPLLGATLDGRYRVDSALGQGGMGRVYRATALVDGSARAIKVLLPHWKKNAEQMKRFERECAALMLLRHPSVVELCDVGRHEGAPYLAMELLEGWPLVQELEDEQALEPARALHIADQILGALEAAHAVGIVHRDVKPENVLVLMGAGDRVKVLDFGLAILVEKAGTPRLTASGEVRGTPLYMSPEQFRGKALEPSSDVYSTGVLLYEMFVGVPPFVGGSLTELMGQHLHMPTPQFGTRNPRVEVNPLVEKWVLAALAKRASDRPSLAQLRAGLAEAARSPVPRLDGKTAPLIAAHSDETTAPGAPRSPKPSSPVGLIARLWKRLR